MYSYMIKIYSSHFLIKMIQFLLSQVHITSLLTIITPMDKKRKTTIIYQQYVRTLVEKVVYTTVDRDK